MKIRKFENAYGISKLNWHSNLNKEDVANYVIYAPNGTFKTSFAKAFANWNTAKDELNNADFVSDIEFCGVKYTNNDDFSDALVFTRDIYSNDSGAEYIKYLIASEVDRFELLNIEKKLETYKNIANQILKEAKINKTTRSIITKNGFTIDELISFFASLNVSSVVENIEKVVVLSKLANKGYDILDEVNFKSALLKYQNVILSRVNSQIFDEHFNELNAQSFLSAVEKASFLSKEKNRQIIIQGKKFDAYADFDTFISDEIDKIIASKEVKIEYEKFIKILGTSKASSDLLDNLSSYPKVVASLPFGKLNILSSIITSRIVLDEYEFHAYVDELKKIKYQVESIYKSAAQSSSFFDEIIAEYERVFSPIFKITIEDRYNALANDIVPEIVFEHGNSRIGTQKFSSTSEISKYLSSGEKSTLFILVFLLNYFQFKRNQDKKFILILDDVVETFDYRNRTGFLEYISILIDDDNCELFVLTHNYEFFRKICRTFKDKIIIGAASLLSSNRHNVIVEKNSRIIIKIEDYISQINNIKSLISSIPFYREIATMVNNNSVKNDLTVLLHYNESTDATTVGNIVSSISSISKGHIQVDTDLQILYIDSLISIAKSLRTVNYFDIKNKIILSIASRILIEKIYVNKDFSVLEDCIENQTKYLYEKLKDTKSSELNGLMKKVLLITPDFIHVNSFMYEPLIDIDPKSLIELFNQIYVEYSG